MSPPRTVHVGPHRVTIRVDEVAHNASQVAATDTLYGYYDTGANRITVAPGLHPSQEAETILHELLHALTSGTGLRAGALEDEAVDEAVVAALSPALLDLLRRNPRLVAYLTASR